ncbi:MAG TPA: hypothetical protein VLN56_04435 [Gammaproteobacteria bacterium]|nr:hypothetical protein [Gammaproteobacteria bacterium]
MPPLNLNWQLITAICVVVSASFGIARFIVVYRQHQAFKKNIRPGVRQRQQAIFQAIEEIIEKANRETYLSSDDVNRFRQATSDTKHLFEMEQQRYLKQLGRKVSALHKVSVPLQTMSLTKEKWDDLNHKHLTLLNWFDGQAEIARNKFRDYLTTAHW